MPRGDAPRRWRILAAALFLALFAAYSIHVKRELRNQADASALTKVPLGRPMPGFTLRDANGKEYDLAQVQKENKVVLVNFWASWCGPCRVEMPSFNALYKKDAKKGLMILAIDEDEKRSNLDTYLKAKPVSFPVLLDPDQALAKRLGVKAFPTTILIGLKGQVMQVVEGVEQYLPLMVEGMLQAKPEEVTATKEYGPVTVTTTTVEPEGDDKKK